MKLAFGRAGFTSDITGESRQLTFAALHLGDHNVNCGIRAFDDDGRRQALFEGMSAAFSSGDIPEAIRLMDKELGSAYSLKNLFSDDRRAILQRILDTSLEEAENAYQQVYEHNAMIARFLRDAHVPLPKAIRAAAELALNSRLRRTFANPDMELEHANRLLEEARASDIGLDSTMLEYALRRTIEGLFEKFAREPHNLELIQRLEAIVDMAHSLPFEVVLWTAQNIWSDVRRSMTEVEQEEEGERWRRHFLSLGEKLQFRVAGQQQALAHGG